MNFAFVWKNDRAIIINHAVKDSAKHVSLIYYKTKLIMNKQKHLLDDVTIFFKINAMGSLQYQNTPFFCGNSTLKSKFLPFQIISRNLLHENNKQNNYIFQPLAKMALPKSREKALGI